jgi:hypothetical protein
MAWAGWKEEGPKKGHPCVTVLPTGVPLGGLRRQPQVGERQDELQLGCRTKLALVWVLCL